MFLVSGKIVDLAIKVAVLGIIPVTSKYTGIPVT